MNILIFLEHESQIIDVVFKISSLLSIFFMNISISSLVLDLFFDILLMKSDDSSLELLEVSDVMKNFEDIILELLLVTFLFIKRLSKVFNLGSKTFLSHSKIINNKCQVLVDSVEMLKFLSHNVGLLL
jgi:hypothetical protein